MVLLTSGVAPSNTSGEPPATVVLPALIPEAVRLSTPVVSVSPFEPVSGVDVNDPLFRCHPGLTNTIRCRG